MDDSIKKEDYEMAPKINGHSESGRGEKNIPLEDELEAEIALNEIEAVNNNLDSLMSALDAMEERTDNIKAQLMELLISNREIRESMQQENQTNQTTNS